MKAKKHNENELIDNNLSDVKRNKSLKILSIVFVAIFSLTLIFSLTFWSLKSKAKIEFHFGNQQMITLDHSQVEALENQIAENAGISNDNNRTSREEPTDPTEPEAPTIVFQDQTIDEMTADWMVVGFMNYALTGDTHYPVPDEDLPTAETTIISPNADDTWITPHLFDEDWTSGDALTYDQFYNYATYVKLFSETVGVNAKQSYLASYLNEFAKKYDEISDVIQEEGFDAPGQRSVWTNYADDDGSSDSIFASETLNLISQTLEYEKDITNYMYVYSYLWQQDSSDKYDYILTSWMNQKRFAYYWTMGVEDKSGFESIAGFNPSNGVDSTEWNDTASAPENAAKVNIEEQWKVSPNGYMGFSGITSKTDSTISLMVGEEDYSENFWDYSKVWGINQYVDDGQTDYDTSYINEYRQGNFADDVYYDKESGNYIFTTTVETDPEDPEAGTTEQNNIYIRFLLYPYAFTDNIQDDGTSDHWYYRLDAYEDADGNLYPAETAPDGSTLINWFDYIDESLTINDGLYGLFEIATIYQIFNYTTTDFDTLQNKAYNYWNAKGFYIELYGSYKSDYGDLIPDGLQRT